MTTRTLDNLYRQIAVTQADPDGGGDGGGGLTIVQRASSEG